MKSLQAKTIAMLSLMLIVSLLLSASLIAKAMDERRIATRYGLMERIAGRLNSIAGLQARERALGVLLLGTSNSKDTFLTKHSDVSEKMEKESDVVVDEIKQFLAFEKNGDVEKKFNEWLMNQEIVQSNRPKIKDAGISADYWREITTKNIETIFSLRTILFSPRDSREKVFYYNAVLRSHIATICEYAGRERALLSAKISSGERIAPEQREMLKSWRSIVDDKIAQVLLHKNLTNTPKQLSAAIDAFDKEFLGHYQQLREQVYAASASGQAYPVNSEEWFSRATQAIDTGLLISTIIGNISAQAADNISESALNFMLFSFVLLVFSILVFAFSIYFMRRLVIHPIGHLVGVMEGIAGGNLSIHIPDQDREDEIGLLAKTAGIMQSQLHALTLEVRTHAGHVYQAAQQILGAIEEQAATTNEMSASVAEITSTMEELSASSTQIAEHSQQVAEIATQNWEDSKQGSKAMQIVLTKMKDIREDNQHSLQEIVDLGKRSKEISKVMLIINTLADQTKLIAFNAALEASSAGEAGRRFGVVAAEIRRLADSVTESTHEIESKIGDIQESISRLVITSEKGAIGIADGMAATSNSNDQLGKLVDAASQTNSAAKQISLSTQQQKTASNQVVVALREIATASNQTAQSIGHISHVSQDMSSLSAKLNEIVGRFNLA